jgi:hypothetical protein
MGRFRLDGVYTKHVVYNLHTTPHRKDDFGHECIFMSVEIKNIKKAFQSSSKTVMPSTKRSSKLSPQDIPVSFKTIIKKRDNRIPVPDNIAEAVSRHEQVR